MSLSSDGPPGGGVGELKNVAGDPPVSLTDETFPAGTPEPTPIYELGAGAGAYSGDSSGLDDLAWQVVAALSLTDRTFQVASAQEDLVKPALEPPKGACDVPQDGFHVKQVEYVRPFKIVGEVLEDAEYKITGDASYSADAERTGEWTVTGDFVRAGEDAATQPVTESGVLEATQQVIVDKVMYGLRDLLDAESVVHAHASGPVYHWETGVFSPTGPMRGDCGTLECRIRDDGAKHHEERDYCSNVEIGGVKLDIKPIREVAPGDFKKYKLHVDPSIPRLCQNSLPKGFLKALVGKEVSLDLLFETNLDFRVVKEDTIHACETQRLDLIAECGLNRYLLHVDPNIPRFCESSLPRGFLRAITGKQLSIDTLFGSDLDFRVIKENRVRACETQSLAKQNFELKYDEVFRRPWTQDIEKVCTKEWTQDGLETGQGTYEQLDGAKITGYYIQPGVEVGQINTYIRQQDEGRKEGAIDAEELSRSEDVPVGLPTYEVTRTDGWSRTGDLRPQRDSFHEEKVRTDDVAYSPTGLVEQEPKYRPVFQKCPLLRPAANSPCGGRLSEEARRALSEPEVGGQQVACIGKLPETLVPGKCVFSPVLGQHVPDERDAARPSAVLYGEETGDASSGEAADGRTAAELKAAYGAALEEALERRERAEELERIAARAGEARGELARELDEARAKLGTEDYRESDVQALEARGRDLDERIAGLAKEQSELAAQRERLAAQALQARQLLAVEVAREGGSVDDAEAAAEDAADAALAAHELAKLKEAAAETAAAAAAQAQDEAMMQDACSEWPPPDAPGSPPPLDAGAQPTSDDESVEAAGELDDAYELDLLAAEVDLEADGGAERLAVAAPS